MATQNYMHARPHQDGLLPSIDTRMDEVAREFCYHIRNWLNQHDHWLAVWGVGPNGSFGASWDDHLAQHSANPLHKHAAAERLGRLLVQRVRQRWPHGMAPHSIGLLSDGSGVAVAPEDPWPLAPGWLDRRLSRPSSLVALHRFDPSGHWAMIAAAQRGIRG